MRASFLAKPDWALISAGINKVRLPKTSYTRLEGNFSGFYQVVPASGAFMAAGQCSDDRYQSNQQSYS
jgi:hypothetical protein